MKNERTSIVTGMELRIYTQDGQNIGMSLTKSEQEEVGKVLGLRHHGGEQLICCFEDGETE